MVYYLSNQDDCRINARVVELVDSLDSGSSVHSGRAGSTPASRTIEKSLGNLVFPRLFVIFYPYRNKQYSRMAYKIFFKNDFLYYSENKN